MQVYVDPRGRELRAAIAQCDDAIGHKYNEIREIVAVKRELISELVDHYQQTWGLKGRLNQIEREK